MSGKSEHDKPEHASATGGHGKDMPASVRTRLTTLAHARGEETEYR
jgi:hypothetical protein